MRLYIPLDEEMIQAGWKTSTSSETNTNTNGIPGAIACPRCGSVTMSMIGYRVMNLSEAKRSNRCNDVSLSPSSPPSHLNHQRRRQSVSNHCHHSNDHHEEAKLDRDAASVLHELLSVKDPIGSLLDKIGRSPPVLGDIPLLANFNLQTFCQPGWYFNLVTFVISTKLHVLSRYLYIVLSY